jgi:hypothetical protein
VPEASVIRRVQALSGFTGRKGFRRRFVKLYLKYWGSTPDTGYNTGKLESVRGNWNSRCRGEIRRYREERRSRKQVSRTVLTLRDESLGSKRD